MDVDQIIFVGVLIFLGSALQSAVGFGFGLFAIPLMIWVGIPLPVAVTVLIVATAVQMGWSCWQYRDDLAWRPALPMVGLRFVTIPVGVFLLSLLATADTSIIRQVVGVLLLLVVLLQWGVRLQPRANVHPAWTLLAGSTSGLLGGLIGMGGPPIILWLMAHDWPPRQARSFLWLVSVLLMPLNLLLLWYNFGSPALHAALVGFAYTPLTLLGASSGLWIGSQLSKPRLRTAMISLLAIIAISSILVPLLG